MVFTVFTVAILASVACSDPASGPDDESPGVLFIGNSLVRDNSLAGTFGQVAVSGSLTFRTGDASKPGVALIDYFFDEGTALAAIAGGTWNYVVLSQGPTWPGLCGDTLSLATSQFSDRIRAAGAQPVLLMPWARTTDMQYLDGVRTAYSAAAAGAGALLVPAGDAWRIALRDDPALVLYDADGYHPAELGTFLTALVIYERITGRDARDLPPAAAVADRNLAVEEATVRLLQNAAHEANAGIVPGAMPKAKLLAAATC
jgi:hypothetical protein